MRMDQVGNTKSYKGVHLRVRDTTLSKAKALKLHLSHFHRNETLTEWTSQSSYGLVNLQGAQLRHLVSCTVAAVYFRIFHLQNRWVAILIMKLMIAID